MLDLHKLTFHLIERNNMNKFIYIHYSVEISLSWKSSSALPYANALGKTMSGELKLDFPLATDVAYHLLTIVVVVKFCDLVTNYQIRVILKRMTWWGRPPRRLDCYPASSMYTCYSVNKVAAIWSDQWTVETSAESSGGRLRSGSTKLSRADCVTDCWSSCSFPFCSFEVISFWEFNCPNLVCTMKTTLY